MGTRLFTILVDSYPAREEALRHFIQAYLASVASMDVEHRRGQLVYLAGMDERVERTGDRDQHGGRGAMDGQRVRREAPAEREV